MWKSIYQLASPKSFYNITGKWINILQILAILLFLIGIFCGLLLAPTDYLQGDAFRIIYVHVPCAFLSMGLYAFMGFLAFILLVWRIKIAGIMLVMAAKTGAIMTFLALVTGSIWGKPMWGTWWIWDARLTSELILLLFYFAILAVQHAHTNREQGEKIIAILTIIGLVNLPIIHYSVVWWNTLHQGMTLSLFAKSKIALSMAYPLFIMLFAFTVYSILMIIMKTRNEILVRERKQSWIREVL